MFKTYLHSQLTSIYECSDYCLKSGEIPGAGGDEPQILAAVLIHGIAVAEEIGISGRYAKIRASQKALEALSEMLPEEFRKKFSCNCRSKGNYEVQGDMGTAI